MIYKDGYKNFLPPPEWEELVVVFNQIISHVNDDYELSSDLLAIGDEVEFRLSDLHKSIIIDANKDPVTVNFDSYAGKRNIIIESTLKDFHLYWCHQLNLMQAVTARKIKISGSLQKIMGLGQVVSSTRKLYIKAICKTK